MARMPWPVSDRHLQPSIRGRANRAERKHAGGLMRINHTGEVCAQALYRGQALVAKTEGTRTALLEAAQEEKDHLDWCEERIDELGTHTSRLNPLFCKLLRAGRTHRRYRRQGEPRLCSRDRGRCGNALEGTPAEAPCG